MEAIKKFVIIGPESTGKTTLCNKLAAHFKTLWVPEYAREYLLKNGTDYSFDDLLTVAKGQIKLEECSLDKLKTKSHSLLNNRQTPVLFIDTDMYVMKVWCEYVFNRCHNWVLNRIAERQYTGYILCGTDIDWVKDELREYPDLNVREKLYYYYKDLLVNQNLPWVDIKGNYGERLEKAIKFIKENT